MSNNQKTSGLVVTGFGVFLTLAAGCSSQPDLGRETLRGNVTFNGQPLPVGEIQFRPDFDRGNQGPGTIAKIVDGTYQTPEQKGIIPGPMVVTISGFDGIPYEYKDGGETIVEKRGKPIFTNYRTNVEIPKGSNEFDISIPQSAATGKK